MTPLPVVFRPQAETETLEVRRWYENRRTKLGDDFGLAMGEAVARVAGNPLTFQRVWGEIRRAILRRFPYALYFRVEPDQIVVLGVLHGRRHPRLWRSRR